MTELMKPKEVTYTCCVCKVGGHKRSDVVDVRERNGTIHFMCKRCKSDIVNFEEDTE